MTLSDLAAEHIGRLVTIEAVRDSESIRYVGVLESFELLWGAGVLAAAGLRISGAVHSLTTLDNGVLEDYTVKVGR